MTAMSYLEAMKKCEITQNTILESALEIFLEKGFGAASVPEIVKRASVAQGTFYRYFKNKKECLNRLVEQLVVMFTEDIKYSLEDTSENALITGPARAISSIRKNKPLIQLVILERRSMDPEMMERLFRMRTLVFQDSVKRYIERGDSEQAATIKAQLVNNLIDNVIVSEVLEEQLDLHRGSISTDKMLETIIYNMKV